MAFGPQCSQHIRQSPCQALRPKLQGFPCPMSEDHMPKPQGGGRRRRVGKARIPLDHSLATTLPSLVQYTRCQWPQPVPHVLTLSMFACCVEKFRGFGFRASGCLGFRASGLYKGLGV